MSDKDREVLNRVRGLLLELLGKPGWEESILLSVSRKKIEGLLDRCERMLQKQDDAVGSDASYQLTLLPSQTEVYISLFQMQGTVLTSWETALKALSSCALGRPVYASEDDVRAFVESRPVAVREGYVKVAIEKDAILQVGADKQSRDPLGKSLLTLRSGAIHVHNIMEFVHANEQRYRFHKGGLKPLVGDLPAS